MPDRIERGKTKGLLVLLRSRFDFLTAHTFMVDGDGHDLGPGEVLDEGYGLLHGRELELGETGPGLACWRHLEDDRIGIRTTDDIG